MKQDKVEKTIFFRVNKNLKNEFFDFCKRRGISTSCVLRLFVLKFLDGSVKPQISTSNILYTGKNASMGFRVSADTYTKYVEKCRKLHVTVAGVFSNFMLNCIEQKQFPFDIYSMDAE